jgi:hypothetical protein
VPLITETEAALQATKAQKEADLAEANAFQ